MVKIRLIGLFFLNFSLFPPFALANVIHAEAKFEVTAIPLLPVG
jgi:hypothetical protein